MENNNLMQIIVEKLGLEMGEEFYICCYRDGKKQVYCNVASGKNVRSKFKFEPEKGLLKFNDVNETWGKAEERMLTEIIHGRPFLPKIGDTYWRVLWDGHDSVIEAFSLSWDGGTKALEDRYCGNCFRTEEEANAEKYNIYKRLTGKEWKEPADEKD